MGLYQTKRFCTAKEVFNKIKGQPTEWENIFADISPQARKTKEKNKQMGLHQTSKFLNSKGNNQQNEMTTH